MVYPHTPPPPPHLARSWLILRRENSFERTFYVLPLAVAFNMGVIVYFLLSRVLHPCRL